MRLLEDTDRVPGFFGLDGSGVTQLLPGTSR